MRAREWAIADNYGTPAAYDIPTLPSWRACKQPCGRLTLSGEAEGAYIAAEPVTVRR